MANAQLNLVNATLAPQEHQHLYELANKLYSDGVIRNDPRLLDEAYHLALLAHEGRPQHIPSLNLLARITLQQQQLPQARAWIEQGLRTKPDSVSLLFSAGHIALAQGDLDSADDYFTQSTRISRVATKAANSLAHVKLLKGDYIEAFQQYRELAKTQANDPQVRSKLFEACSHIVADFYSDELAQDTLRYLQFDEADHSQLRGLVTSLLSHQLQLTEQGCPLELENIASNTLLLKSLTRFYFCDPLFERLLMTLRQSLLLTSSRNLAIAKEHLGLVHALAYQCLLNESVWYINEQEHALVEQLSELIERMLQSPGLGSDDLYPILLLIMMYQPLTHCRFWSALQHRQMTWPGFMAELMQQQLQQPRELAELASQLTSIGDSPNAVSQRVREQYNQHPYPCWRDIGYNQPSHYWQTLEATFPHALQGIAQRHQNTQSQIFVAGCGTGRHALRLASYFYSVDVTALDFSHSALAYAMQQANRYRIQHVHFVQGDLLLSERLGQQWDVIECSGVLHHMESPAQGLHVLCKQLKHDGVIKIALYSRRARRSIWQLRERLGKHLPTQANDMRLVRESLLQGALSGDWQAILESPDFYSLSACRDLLFHQQEHVYDVEDLPAWYGSTDLEWVGMIPPNGSAALAQQYFGLHADQLTPTQWAEIENDHPQLFAGMYQFYLRKKRAA